jgi:hypothetical protein
MFGPLGLPVQGFLEVPDWLIGQAAVGGGIARSAFPVARHEWQLR